VKSRIAVGLQFAVALVVMGALCYSVDWKRMAAVATTVSPLWFCIAVAVFQFGLVVQTWRWQLVLKALPFDVPNFRRLYTINIVGLFFSNLLPGSVSGDAMKIWYLGGQQGWRYAITGTLLARFVGIVVLFFVAAVAVAWDSAFSPIPLAPQPLVAFALLLATAMAGAFALSPPGERLARAVASHSPLPSKFKARLLGLFEPLALWRRNRRLAVGTVLTAMLYNVVGIGLATSACAAALRIDLPIATTMSIGLLVSAALILPIAVGGLGIAEGIYAGSIAYLGHSLEEGVALGLLLRLILIAHALVGGIAFACMAKPGRPQDAGIPQ